MSPIDDQVEAAAMALYGLEYDLESYPWETAPEKGKDAYRHTARAALTAALARSAEGDWQPEVMAPKIVKAMKFEHALSERELGLIQEAVHATLSIALSTSRPTQAEGIEQLQKDRLDLTIQVTAESEDNARLRAALAKYADPNYNGHNGSHEHAARVLAERPVRARRA